LIHLDKTPTVAEVDFNVVRCPFCRSGGDLLVIVSQVSDYPPRPSFFVKCLGCTAQGPGAGWLARAVEAWNRSARKDKTNG
jgi:hypothetical protein